MEAWTSAPRSAARDARHSSGRRGWGSSHIPAGPSWTYATRAAACGWTRTKWSCSTDHQRANQGKEPEGKQ